MHANTGLGPDHETGPGGAGRTDGSTLGTRRHVTVAMTVVAVLLVCGGAVLLATTIATSRDQSAGSGGPAVAVPGQGPLIVNEVDSEYWPAAEVVGQLQLSDGCLLLDGPDGLVVAVWPPRSRWLPESQVVLPGGVEPGTRVGEVFRGGGGFAPVDETTSALIGEEAGQSVQECSRSHGNVGLVIVAPIDS